jgi:hypothetical protein
VWDECQQKVDAGVEIPRKWKIAAGVAIGVLWLMLLVIAARAVLAALPLS